MNIQIKPIAEKEIKILEQNKKFNYPPKHRKRFTRQQKGEAMYLIAWHEDEPVGHVFIRWSGTVDEPMASELQNCPHIEDMFVIPEFRSKGIGSELMDTAEDMCAQKLYTRVGLGVGADNVHGRALYEKRGYRDAGFGEHRTTYPYIDKNGQQQSGEETCIYLIKELR